MRNLMILPIRTIHQIRTLILLALLVTGFVLVPNADAQDNDRPQLTVVVQALNVRSGPGLTYPAFDILVQGDEVAVSSYDAASDWWQVQLPDGSPGWVSGGSAYVSVSGDTTGLSEGAGTIPSAATISPAASSISTLDTGGTIVFQTASGGPIYAINADGRNLRYLTTGLDPALSPDGQWVAFSRWDNNQRGALGSLWVINVDGSGERAVLGEIHQPKSPVWSPDGTQIIISMQHGGRVDPERKCGSSRPPRGAFNVSISRHGGGDIEICYTLPPDPYWGLRVVNVTTGEFEDLPHERYSFSPTWDPANAWRLVYDGNMGLVNLDLTRSENVDWPLTTDVNDHSPTFSPDGTKIAVSYRQHDHWEIHVLNADGSGRFRLTETPWPVIVEQEINGETPRSWNNAAPTWSPDGSQIAFLTDRTGQWEIWVMNADGSNQRPLVPAEALAGITLQYYGVDERVLSWR